MPKITNYEIKYIVCPRCGAYMYIRSTWNERDGLVTMYYCVCGKTLLLVERFRQKKEPK